MILIRDSLTILWDMLLVILVVITDIHRGSILHSPVVTLRNKDTLPKDILRSKGILHKDIIHKDILRNKDTLPKDILLQVIMVDIAQYLVAWGQC